MVFARMLVSHKTSLSSGAETMLLPQGTDVWSELSTFFVDVDNLIYYVRNLEFHGCIHCRFSNGGREGIIFLQEGEAVCGILDTSDDRVRGPAAVRRVLERARSDRKASVTVRRLSAKAVEIISEVLLLPARTVHTQLSKEFLDLEKYIGRLQKEGFNGYIEIRFHNDNQEGIIFFREGSIHSLITSSLQLDMDKATNNHLKLFDIHRIKLVQRAKQHGISYNVYATPLQA
jgi:hypothetical protein